MPEKKSKPFLTPWENIMREITTLGDLKGRLQAGFENNEESLEDFGKTYSTQLKAYLIESNRGVDSEQGENLEPDIVAR